MSITSPVEMSIHAVSPASALGGVAAAAGDVVPPLDGGSAQVVEVIARQHARTRPGEASMRITERSSKNTGSNIERTRIVVSGNQVGRGQSRVFPGQLSYGDEPLQGSCRDGCGNAKRC